MVFNTIQFPVMRFSLTSSSSPGNVWEDLDSNMLILILCLTSTAMYQAASETGKKVHTCLRRLKLFKTKP